MSPERNDWTWITLLSGVFVAIAMPLMPPWRDLEVPPFGSAEHFAGYSPTVHPPHDPWTLPLLTDREFWNSQHDYRRNWTVLGVQEAVVFLVTVAAALLLRRHGAPGLSIPGAVLGGFGALIIGLIGVTAIMAPMLEVAPWARVVTTSLLLAGYVTVIVAGTVFGANLRLATLARVMAGLFAGQFAFAYVVFAYLDHSPSSHRIMFLVWLVAATVGAVAGTIWALRSAKELGA